MLYDRIVSRTFVDKGWSGDRKYRAETGEGEVVLLRISPAEKQTAVAQCFARMKEAEKLGISMCRPLEWGTCDEGVYFIQSWVEGSDAEEKVPFLEEPLQYDYGFSAGADLRKLHTVPAPADIQDWEIRYGSKIDRKLRMYAASQLKYDEDGCILSFIAENRHLIAGRPQSYQHGDHHIGNMMVSDGGKIVLIDFEKEDFGDPWEEFNRIVWSAQASPCFASGLVDGYFEGDVPELFWRLLALYICTNTLGSLPWAVAYGEGEVAVMREQQKQVLEWYDRFHRVVPTWYRSGGGKVTSLRRVRETDMDAVTALLLDSTVAETYMVPDDMDEARVKKLFERLLQIGHTPGRYLRIICEGDIPVGMIHDTQIEEGTVELGWAILSAFHGRGHGTRALAMALRELKTMGFRKVTAGAFGENAPSIRIMQKNGMIRQHGEQIVSYRGRDRKCFFYAIGLEELQDG